MSDSGAQPPVPDGDPEPGPGHSGDEAAGSAGAAGMPGLEDLLGMLGMSGMAGSGAAGGHHLGDLEAIVRELLGPDAALPPELTQMMTALQGDPATDPMAAMVQRQLRSFFGGQDPQERLATATDLARKVAAGQGDRTVGAAEAREVETAVAVARLWLDPVTAFDSPGGPVRAWSAAEWIEATMPRWFSVVEPVADGFAAAGSDALRRQLGRLGEEGGLPPALGALGRPDDSGDVQGGLAGMFAQMGPALERMSEAMFTAQLGHAVGTLSGDLLSATEIGLPLTDEGVVALLPERVARFAEELELDLAQVRLHLAVREAARVRLFAEVPWLAAQLEASVRDYGRHIVIDTDAIEAALREVDPSDPEAVQRAFSTAELFANRPTPQQQAALTRLETTLALVEGWVDLVTDAAVAAHLPGSAALGEAVRRRRAGGPAERTFAGLVGLELRPRRLRDARNLWAALESAGGMALRDSSWDYPDLAPTAADLDDPLGYVDRVRADATDSFDAELEQFLTDAEGSAGPAGSGAGDEPPSPS